MVYSSFLVRNIKKAVNRHGLFARYTKKPWVPEEVPTAFIFNRLSDQQWTNPSLMSFHHHQFILAIFIFISVSLIFDS